MYNDSSYEVTVLCQVYKPARVLKDLKASDSFTKFLAAMACHGLLKDKGMPPTPLVEAGIVPLLIDSLPLPDNATILIPKLQHQAASCLSIISSEHPKAIIDAGGIPMLIKVLDQAPEFASIAALTLGRIAAAGSDTRDAVLKAGTLTAMLPHMRLDTPSVLLQETLVAYMQICRKLDDGEMVGLEQVSSSVPHIADILLIKDECLLKSACSALYELTCGPLEYIEAVQVVPGLMDRLVACASRPNDAVALIAVQTINNMLLGNDEHVERCLDAGCLDTIQTFLRSDDNNLIWNAARAAANIFAGTGSQLQRALCLLEPLSLVLPNADSKIQLAAVRAITNITSHGTTEQLSTLQETECLTTYCAQLASPSPDVVSLVLDGLTNMFQMAAKEEKEETLCCKFEDMGVIDRIEGLQHHENVEIYKKNLHLINKYIGVVENAEIKYITKYIKHL